ncbi:long-chain-fatty-acid--CoA ligase [Gordonia neofelifaecis]|uniref:AMP-dependent synthetase and ligase n=1 Tax=Gordonia neofelifaecis NRRL B-59395 TaxID=644548 RepID=F1YMY0_9ACTN|nr:long-chain fatty acid--CoA ligase [Gordonia neofelifaecis]EGD54065.1 AMP-dependent synthetase and ligase [Gordonia neofelifaecis NRRL B-59395]
MANLSLNLVEAAASRPEHTALKCGDATYSYAEFDQAAAKVATLLADRGIEPGDRVGLMLPNVPEFAILFYGILRAGAVAVPMNPLLKSREIAYYLSNTTASLLFAVPAFADEAKAGAEAAGAACVLADAELTAAIGAAAAQSEPVARDDFDTAVILHTSGTTGKPKGAELTHIGLHRNAEICVRTLFGAESDDVMMGCLPLFHVFGLTCGLNASVIAQASLTLIPRFEPISVLEAIAADKVTIFLGVPTMYSALVAARRPGDDASSLRVCASGGAALPAQVIVDFEAAFDAAILEGYGLSETSPVACFNHPDRPRKPGTIGTPIEGVEMRIVDAEGNETGVDEPGEVQIKGHNIMKGYWNLPEATAEAIDADGWFSSGDVGAKDADGYYRIVDRTKDMIIRGGMNVYPREVEEVLYEHPAVAAAAVIGIPHESLGEDIGAAVELKAGVEVTVDELREYVKERVAAYKYPRQIWFLDALPTGATGKIQKRDITVPTAATREA